MAWPYDAVIRAYGPLQQVIDDDLNEIQERIVDLHLGRMLIIQAARPQWDAAGVQPSWRFNDSTNYWYSIAADNLIFHISAANGYRLSGVGVKFYGNGANAIVGTLYQAGMEIATPANAPAGLGGGTTIASFSTVSNGAWTVDNLVPAAPPAVVLSGEELVVKITPGQNNDRCAGIAVLYEPITATP